MSTEIENLIGNSKALAFTCFNCHLKEFTQQLCIVVSKTSFFKNNQVYFLVSSEINSCKIEKFASFKVFLQLRCFCFVSFMSTNGCIVSEFVAVIFMHIRLMSLQ